MTDTRDLKAKKPPYFCSFKERWKHPYCKISGYLLRYQEQSPRELFPLYSMQLKYINTQQTGQITRHQCRHSIGRSMEELSLHWKRWVWNPSDCSFPTGWWEGGGSESSSPFRKHPPPTARTPEFPSSGEKAAQWQLGNNVGKDSLMKNNKCRFFSLRRCPVMLLKGIQ